jgi:hypothetical protein
MELTRRLFFLGLGLTALVAVGSYWTQLPGLAGSRGIAPIADTMAQVRASPGLTFWDFPTVLWLSSSDAALHGLCAAALLSAALLVLGALPRWASLALWASWLSLVRVGQPFLSFQWDLLLVETAFFAAWYAPGGWSLSGARDAGPAVRFVMAWLACKVTLGSGVVKLASGDPTWRDLTALTYHWWTQPLPTWTSVWLNQLPLVGQKLLCAAMFVLELAAPLFALGPRLMRLTGAAGLIALQLGLLAAGNYSYYNVLTLLLAVPLLDDAALGRLLGRPALPVERRRSPWWQWALAALVVVLGLKAFLRSAVTAPLVDAAWARVEPFETINGYGAFAVMTKTRPEIILEGSRDGVTWLAYEFPYKPGRLDRRPEFVAPFQPRLDWQMWFAALADCSRSPWLFALQRHLLLGTPEVLRLFAEDPFAGAPPERLRTRVFEYRFALRDGSDVWWTRTETGPFCPPVRLGPDGRLVRAEPSQ